LKIAIITALGVGGATVCGALLGFIFRRISAGLSGCLLSFCAGIMLAATAFGLFVPAIELDLLLCLLGTFSGAMFMDLLGRFVHKTRPDTQSQNKVLLFVAAIAIHNLPEGIAAGVGFGTEHLSDALLIAGGIALQNIPEGMIVIGPLLDIGIRKSNALLIGAGTGMIEVVGTVMGYFAIRICSAFLPFALAFAGGTMLFIICEEMIPESSNGSAGIYYLLAGFSLMLILSAVL
jgi:ZIP family zinc transporter